MSWTKLLQNDAGSSTPLRQRVDALFAQQRETWPALRDGEAALTGLQRKSLELGGDAIIVQINPARRRSTLAKTDAAAVAARACFLCPENMPAEERGVAFEDLVVLPNPYPILPLHCTIAVREHQPQQLAGRVDQFLRLAKEIGPDLAALYNGPRCGASAPDHFHFQATRSEQIPIVARLSANANEKAGVAHSSFGRHMLIFASTSAAEIHTKIERSIGALRQIEGASDEPMLNVLAHYEGGRYSAVLFPRAAHRPARYFSNGPDKLLVSPAILEMCGILVTTETDDFARIDAPTACAIYEEVSIAADRLTQLVAKVT